MRKNSEYLSGCYDKGLEKFKDLKRAKALSDSLTSATALALEYPECQVKVTCKDVDECVYIQTLLHLVLEDMKILEDSISKMGQIELTNGSCILIRSEQ